MEEPAASAEAELQQQMHWEHMGCSLLEVAEVHRETEQFGREEGLEPGFVIAGSGLLDWGRICWLAAA